MSTLELVIYVNVVAALWSVAAHCGELACGYLDRPRRALWIGALCASVGMFVWAILVPSPVAQRLSAFEDAVAASASAAPNDSAWQLLILLGPLFVALLLVRDMLVLRALKRRWRVGDMDGVPVLLSEDFGPAVVGLRVPRIVVPRHVFALPAEQRRMLLLHELEHVRAHDGRALVGALVLIALCPWAVATWWQLHRLRIAIEMDCDRRVMRHGERRHAYASLLVDMAARSVHARLLAVTFTVRRSSLRRRVEALSALTQRGWSRRTLLAVITSVGALSAACWADRPAGPPMASVAVVRLRETLRVRQQRLAETVAAEKRRSAAGPPTSVLLGYLTDRVQMQYWRDTPAWRFRQKFIDSSRSSNTAPMFKSSPP